MRTDVFLSYDARADAIAHAVQHDLVRSHKRVVDAGRQRFDDARWPAELRWALEDCACCLIVADADALVADGMLRRQIGVALGLGRPVTWLMPAADAARSLEVAPATVHRAYFDAAAFASEGLLRIDFDDEDPVLGHRAAPAAAKASAATERPRVSAAAGAGLLRTA